MAASDDEWPDPWPSGQPSWADPPWRLVGRAITAWFSLPRERVARLLSPALMVDEPTLRVRLRFYDLEFASEAPGDGRLTLDRGRFREAAIGVPAQAGDVRGETSVCMWSDSPAYQMWGREAYGWPILPADFEFEGAIWDPGPATGAVGRAVMDDGFGTAALENVRLQGPREAPAGSPSWLTPRRLLRHGAQARDEREVVVVRPTIRSRGSAYEGTADVRIAFGSDHPLGDMEFTAAELDVVDGIELLVAEHPAVIPAMPRRRSPVAPSPGAVSIARVNATTIRLPLRIPARVGAHEIAEREYAIVAIHDAQGNTGTAYSLTRGAPLQPMLERLVAPGYAGATQADPRGLYERALAGNPTVLSTGSGLRALSLVDMAVWDLVARSAGVPLARVLGGNLESRPALLVIGFPPTVDAATVAAEARDMYALGWRTFKLAIGADPASTRARLEAVASAGPDARLVLDAAWSWRGVDQAVAELEPLADLPFAWVEDPFVPRSASEVAALRRRVTMPIGAGDEQGGAYFPEALLDAGALDVLRLDATAVGGVSGFAIAADHVAGGAVELSCHVHGRLHHHVLCGLGLDGWLEYGRPGSGVDPLGDELLPVPDDDGRVALPDELGAGPPPDLDALRRLDCADPERSLAELGLDGGG